MAPITGRSIAMRLASQLAVASSLIALAITLRGQSKVELKPAPTPDFGPNVLVFTPSMPASGMQQQIDRVYKTQQHNEFGSERNAVLFLPGEYHIDVPVGFYTQVVGLGATPDAVHITGNVHSDASLPRNNATPSGAGSKDFP